MNCFRLIFGIETQAIIHTAQDIDKLQIWMRDKSIINLDDELINFGLVQRIVREHSI